MSLLTNLKYHENVLLASPTIAIRGPSIQMNLFNGHAVWCSYVSVTLLCGVLFDKHVFPLSSSATLEGGPQMNMSSLFRHVVRTEGAMGLYRGLAPNFMKVIPSVSISYVVYEYLKIALGVQSKWAGQRVFFFFFCFSFVLKIDCCWIEETRSWNSKYKRRNMR